MRALSRLITASPSRLALPAVGVILLAAAAGCAGDGASATGSGDAGAGQGAGGPGAGGGQGAGGGNGGGSSGCNGAAPLESYTEKVEVTPDYTQTDPAYGGFVNGYNYCGPTAVSNSIMWLSDTGFPDLAPHTDDRKRDQHDVIVELGSAAYFNTDPEGYGTPPTSLMEGLKRYVTDKGYGYVRIAWQGWNALGTPPEFDTGVEVPEIDWVKVGVQGTASAWLLLGLGHYEPATDEYVLTSGHWITLVGHGFDGQGVDPSYLIAHDPWSPGDVTHAYVRLDPLQGGTFVPGVPDAPPVTQSAAGYYRLIGDFQFSAPEVYLLGAVVLEMPCAE
jgi:hypothetical protein